MLELLIVGAGAMGSAIARGLADDPQGPRTIGVADVDTERAAAVAASSGRLRVAAPGERARTTILAVKPTQLPAACDALAEGSRVISIAAGVATGKLRELAPSAAAIVRVMPNLALAVRRGVTLVARSPLADPTLLEEARALFGRLGIARDLDETLVDAGTALSGSGPAFVLLFVEALQEGAIARGIPAPLALELVTETLAGTAELLRANPASDPRSLRLAVTSPGGTTAAGLQVLEARALRAALQDAIAAAEARARELA
jgi:pyrroline-5-carboxylate reductase